MKILDIISQQTNEGALDAFMKGFEKGSGKVASKTATPADRAIAGAERGSEKTGEKVAARTSWEKFEDWAVKQIEKDAAKETSAAAKAKVLQVAEKELGFWLGLLNLAGWVAWYNFVAKPRLDAEYKAGNMQPAEYQEKLTWLRGELVTRVILPRVAIKIATSKTISWLPARLPWLMEKVGAKESAAITKGVATLVTTGAAYTIPTVFHQFIAESIGNVAFFPTGVAFNLAGQALSALTSLVSPTAPKPAGADLTWSGPSAEKAKQDIDATSNEPVFGPQEKNIKWADTSKKFF